MFILTYNHQPKEIIISRTILKKILSNLLINNNQKGASSNGLSNKIDTIIIIIIKPIKKQRVSQITKKITYKLINNIINKTYLKMLELPRSNLFVACPLILSRQLNQPFCHKSLLKLKTKKNNFNRNLMQLLIISCDLIHNILNKN